jgi:hypothetical protein
VFCLRLFVLLDPLAFGRGAVLHKEENVVRRRGDVVAGRRGHLHAPQPSRLHGRSTLQHQRPLPLRVRVRRERRTVLVHRHSPHSLRHRKRNPKHLVVLQRPRHPNDTRPHITQTAIITKPMSGKCMSPNFLKKNHHEK